MSTKITVEIFLDDDIDPKSEGWIDQFCMDIDDALTKRGFKLNDQHLTFPVKREHFQCNDCDNNTHLPIILHG